MFNKVKIKFNKIKMYLKILIKNSHYENTVANTLKPKKTSNAEIKMQSYE